MDIKAILVKSQDPMYTPPITLKQLGIMLFEANESPESHWPDTVRLWWWRTLRASAYADGVAYMVRSGERVAI